MADGSSTHYDVLGVPRSASFEEIRAAYRSAARRGHPDSGGDVDGMQRINQAWYVLQDPGRRTAYDDALRGPRPVTGRAPSEQAPRSTSPVDDEPAVDEMADPMEEDDGNGPWPVDEPMPPGSVPAIEGWLALLPPAALVLAVGLTSAAFLFASPALLVFAGGAYFLSFGLFVLLPLWAFYLAANRDPDRRRPEE